MSVPLPLVWWGIVCVCVCVCVYTHVRFQPAALWYIRKEGKLFWAIQML